MGKYIATIAVGSKNKSISIEDYKGRLSINSTWEGNRGTQDNWIYESEWKDGAFQPGERRPQRIYLGEPEDSIRILRQLLQAVERHFGAAGDKGQTGSPAREPLRGLPGQTPAEGPDRRGAQWPGQQPSGHQAGQRKLPDDDIPF